VGISHQIDFDTTVPVEFSGPGPSSTGGSRSWSESRTAAATPTTGFDFSLQRFNVAKSRVYEQRVIREELEGFGLVGLPKGIAEKLNQAIDALEDISPIEFAKCATTIDISSSARRATVGETWEPTEHHTPMRR